ncbi:3-carboxy-cis,cis-muconate cycloisomerase [Pacificispira sp.]|uniref:3-carboxy-cis,cis-muconate cycloisomerase n=1 Tax=Pacificispira sp. TaxID=2888761 RepID=UPI003BABA0E8
MSFTTKSQALLSQLAGDPTTEALFTDLAERQAILRFEAALAVVQARLGLIPKDAAAAIVDVCGRFEADPRDLATAMARDGVTVPGLIRQLREAIGEPHAKHLHFGTTSQDAIDTALALRLADFLKLLDGRLNTVLASLHSLADRFGDRALMGRTRMQAALPIRVADRINIWAAPVEDRLATLNTLSPSLLRLQLAGPVGTSETLGPKATDLRAALAQELGLTDPGRSWQTDRTALTDFGSWLSSVCGVLGKIGQDVALMAQMGGDEIALSGGGGSSAMPHKSNPVRAETLVALARYTATLLPGLHAALIHEQERSGSAWTLEWLILPDMCIATAAATRHAQALLDAVESLGQDGAPGR